MIRAAAPTPHSSISQVTPFALIGVRSSSHVAYGEMRRTYRRPAQCSPLTRPKIASGCTTARTSATEGLDVRTDVAPHLLLAEVEVLEDRVAVRAGARRVQDGLGELLLAQPEVRRRARQPVPREAGVELATRSSAPRR